MALSGGIALVGLAIILVNRMDGNGSAAGDLSASQATEQVLEPSLGKLTVAAPVAFDRVPVDPLALSSTIIRASALDGGPWAGSYGSKVHVARQGSASDWLAHYAEISDAVLQNDAIALIIEGCDRERVIGFLRAIEKRGAVQSREAFLLAARLPADDHSLSIPSIAIASLVDAAAEKEVRLTLSLFVWERHPQTQLRLRCRAAAALASWAQPDEFTALHDQLWRELEPAVVASALGAARASNPALQPHLFDLDPSFDWGWNSPANRGQSGLRDH